MNFRGRQKGTGGSRPLERQLWRSYLHAAIIPLLLIELTFLAIYWVSSSTTYDRNVETVSKVSREYLADVAEREATTVEEELRGVANLTSFFASQTQRAYRTPFDPPASEKARYVRTADGAFLTTRGRDETAGFYSGYVPIGPQQIEKVWRLSQLDPVMKDIKKSSPLITQIYLNTFDSYNRIYPYFDVLAQYVPKMNIASYNFYYEADAKHNPARKAVWTDAYVDPAGAGWMVSSIAPVYVGDRLEAVVGLDLTIDTIIRQVLDIDLPWSGYAVLISRDGTILALPEAGERDLALNELKDHQYAAAIKSNMFKPEAFNVHKRRDLRNLAKALDAAPGGVTQLTLGGRTMLAAHAGVAGPGWHLVVLAPETAILAEATQLRSELYAVGAAMVAVLLLFYIAFFVFLSVRARAMSRRVAEPLTQIEGVMSRIGDGEYDQQTPQSGITEVDNLAEKLVDMGRRLGRAHKRIVEQESAVRAAFDREKAVASGQRRFIDVLSHEFRTPLTVIDSCAQILKRRAGSLSPAALTERSEMLRRAADRVNEVLGSALQLVRLEEGGASYRPSAIDIRSMVADLCGSISEAYPDVTVSIHCEAVTDEILADRDMIRTALGAVLDNAFRFSRAGGAVQVRGEQDQDETRIIVSDEGSGIAEDDLPHVCERFYRGANSTVVPGAGVGLYLASTCLRVHGGALKIDSSVGSGTTVTLSLPRRQPKRVRQAA